MKKGDKVPLQIVPALTTIMLNGTPCLMTNPHWDIREHRYLVNLKTGNQFVALSTDICEIIEVDAMYQYRLM